MRIAIFSDCAFPTINGVSSSVAYMAEGLVQSGHQVCLVVPLVPHNKGSILDNTNNVNNVNNEPGTAQASIWDERSLTSHRGGLTILRLRSWTFPWLKDNRIANICSWGWVKQLRELRPEVIHIQTPFAIGLLGILFGRLYGVKRVFTHHTLFEEYTHYLPLPAWAVKWGAWSIIKLFVSDAAEVIAPSRLVGDLLLKQGLLRPRRQAAYHVIPTGIAKEWLNRLELPRKKRLIYVGRLAAEKSIDYLLRAFKQVSQREPGVELCLIGDGPYRRQLEEYAEQLGLKVGGNVRFLGWRRREELPQCYAQACCFVFASRTETQGLVLLEAQACGLPCVAVRAQGVEEALQPAISGYLVEYNNMAEFINCICSVIDSFAEGREDFRKMSDSARLFARNYLPAIIINKLLKVYSLRDSSS